LDGCSKKFKLQYDNESIKNSLQQIAILAGYTSYILTRNKTNYVKIRKQKNVTPTHRKEIEYNGIVWCPSVDDGTAVFRKNGCVYISGQSQAPFSNITLDWVVPEDLRDMPCIVGGKSQKFCYKDCQMEMDLVNKALLNLYLEGDAEGRGFQYPIPTYNLTKDFKWDTENAKLLFDMTAKYGTPYFQNFINSDLNPSDVRSMCCRLQLDKKELRKKGGGLFGSDELTGSIGVVTINLPKISYETRKKNLKQFFKKLDYLIDLSIESLEIKRKECLNFLKCGLYPYTKKYLKKEFDNHFSTIGIIGAWEAYVNRYNNKNIEKYVEFSVKILDHIRKKLQDIQIKTGNLYNLEATPSEGTCYRLAKQNLKQYPDIYTSGLKTKPYYTNSTWLPVDAVSDVFDAIDIQDPLQIKYTGGTVFHCFLGERLSDGNNCKELVKTIANNYHLPYFSISPTYSICLEHGYLDGEHFICPKCEIEINKLKEDIKINSDNEKEKRIEYLQNLKTEVYSRIVGYYRNVNNWNIGKQQEFKERIPFISPLDKKK
jgi:ribonucleoside-triphosphate reductase